MLFETGGNTYGVNCDGVTIIETIQSFSVLRTLHIVQKVDYTFCTHLVCFVGGALAPIGAAKAPPT